MTIRNCIGVGTGAVRSRIGIGTGAVRSRNGEGMDLTSEVRVLSKVSRTVQCY
jgi:hypothetical protein